MKHVKTILCVLLGVMLVCTSMMAADQQKAQRKTLMIKKPVPMPMVKVKLICHASLFTGKCPVTVMMDGKIFSTGPVTVYYHFKRSDNAVMRAVKLVFRARGTKTIPFRWKLGKDGTYSVQLIVKVGKKEIKSNIKGFMVDCEEAQKPKLQIKKFDPKLLKAHVKVGGLKLKLKKIKRPFVLVKKVPVDLVVAEVKPWRTWIPWTYPQRIIMKFENHGTKASPRCYLYVTLTSSRPSPKTGKKVFVHKYTLRSLRSGYSFTGAVGWRGFWPGKFNVKVHVDATNIIKEGIKESNNYGYTSFEVR